MTSSDRTQWYSSPRRTLWQRSSVFRFAVFVAVVGVLAVLGGGTIAAISKASPPTTQTPPAVTFATITRSPARVAQNANWVACYKPNDKMQYVRFRWCPSDKPYTPTNETRNFCYATSEACARAEMPQSWCMKCVGKPDK